MTTGGNLERTARPRIDNLDPVVSCVLGIVLLSSGIPHWVNPYYFLASVYAYDLVGPQIGQMVAMVLPPLQLIVAVCLITRTWLDAAHLIAMLMFGGFLTAQSLAYVQGLDISCGCFGPCHETLVGVTSLLTVGGLLVTSIVRNGLRWRLLGST